MYTLGMELWHEYCFNCGLKFRGHPAEKVKLYRIYRRIKISGKWKFVSFGWICPKCKRVDIDDMMTIEDGKTVRKDSLTATPTERKTFFDEWNIPDDEE